MKSFKSGDKIVAKQNLVLFSGKIPKGTLGHISRISPRLKKVLSEWRGWGLIAVKFPKFKSFFTVRDSFRLVK